MLIIDKLFKIRAWWAIWYNAKQFQLPKYTEDNHDSIFSGFCFNFWVSISSLCVKWICNIHWLDILCFIFLSLQSVNVVLVGF